MIQQTTADRERNIIASHLERELAHALELKARASTPDDYRDTAAAFEQVARRCRSLVEEEE